MSSIKIVECSRDAMQGIKQWIPSKIKLDYLQSVLSVGFDVVDFGSFVSKRAIPQMSDSAFIIDNLDLSDTKSKLLAIVANERGAIEACSYSSLSFLGFPFSISEIFQMRNTNKSIDESFEELKRIKSIAEKYNKQLVVYLSMGFGNPYGEPWNYEIVEMWIEKLSHLKIQIICARSFSGKNLFQCLHQRPIRQIRSGQFVLDPMVTRFSSVLPTSSSSTMPRLESS